ncbi:transposase [Labilibaculum filiforme]|uniref:Transposase n=1 Tax=Labilibaculum filiforme TaxID=1940526 RepID=A0A2N3I621_9BACT|nr:IS200/IS605 family transposase [Labilibaculum filiforme]PKQ65757.1 transposase [Labilibaculum filiforme]
MKPGSYTQLYVQLIFAVKFRDSCLRKNIRERVFAYISGIIREMNHKSIIVGGVEDHIHILIGVNANKSISETVHEIKRTSSLFINKEKLCMGKFAWQEGYGAFSYSRSQLNSVYNYILNQEEHHHKNSFRKEYIQFLKKFEIEFDEKFLFEFHD